MLTPETRLKKLQTYFLSQRYVQAAYLFGSAAKGTQGPLSDVDVAVILNSEQSSWYEQKLKLVEGLCWIFGVPRVDVVVLNSAEPVLAHRVLFEGNLIFVRDMTAKVRTEKKVLKEYLDTGFLRRVHMASIKEQVKEGEYFG